MANQKRPLATVAVAAMLEAMEATPTILHIGLGTLREDTWRKRLQAITMANTEAMRQRRLQAAHAAANGDDLPAATAKLLHRRSASFERPKNRATSRGAAAESSTANGTATSAGAAGGAAGGGAASAAPVRRAPSFGIRSRMLQISNVVEKVPQATVTQPGRPLPAPLQPIPQPRVPTPHALFGEPPTPTRARVRAPRFALQRQFRR